MKDSLTHSEIADALDTLAENHWTHDGRKLTITLRSGGMRRLTCGG
jgi:hypothetical protein